MRFSGMAQRLALGGGSVGRWGKGMIKANTRTCVKVELDMAGMCKGLPPITV